MKIIESVQLPAQEAAQLPFSVPVKDLGPVVKSGPLAAADRALLQGLADSLHTSGEAKLAFPQQSQKSNQ